MHAVHDAVSHPADRTEQRLRLQPVQQEVDRGAADLRLDAGGRVFGGVIDTEVRLRAADAVDFSLQQRFRRPLRCEDREANARGTAIDGQ